MKHVIAMESSRDVGNNPRILIIDDDPTTCKILEMVFERKGYAVEIAASGQAGIATAQLHPFDLALLDLRLPDGDGIDLIAPLRQRHPHAAVIVITGHASLETAVQALNSGASAYITKPFNMDEIVATIGNVLEKQRLRAEKRQAEAALQRRNCELALFNRVIHAATSTLDAAQVLQVACEGLAHAFDVPKAAALLLNADGTEGTFVAEFRADGQHVQMGRTIPISGYPISELLFGIDAPLALTEVHQDARFEAAHELLCISGACSLLMVPIPVARGRVAGTIGLQTPDRREFSSDEITLAQNVAAAAGQALETARLYQALRRNIETLEETVAQRTAALQVALERAKDADRVKSEFVSNVSHELRTPLSSLKLYLGLLNRGQPEKRESYLETVGRETDRLQDLIESLLDISRLDLGKMQARREPTDLNRLVETLAIDRSAMARDRGLVLRVELEPELPCVEADPKLISQVLTNLLTNAVNYTPAGGQITLSTGLVQAGDGQWFTTRVADTGPGIPAAERPHLFERFYRGTAGQTGDAPGTGLGLAICKEIMDLHHGRVSLESAPAECYHGSDNGKSGPGSTFVVWLPRTDPESDQTTMEKFESAGQSQQLLEHSPAHSAGTRG